MLTYVQQNHHQMIDFLSIACLKHILYTDESLFISSSFDMIQKVQIIQLIIFKYLQHKKHINFQIIYLIYINQLLIIYIHIYSI